MNIETKPSVKIDNDKIYFCGVDITDNVQSYRIIDGRIYLSLLFSYADICAEGTS